MATRARPFWRPPRKERSCSGRSFLTHTCQFHHSSGPSLWSLQPLTVLFSFHFSRERSNSQLLSVFTAEYPIQEQSTEIPQHLLSWAIWYHVAWMREFLAKDTEFKVDLLCHPLQLTHFSTSSGFNSLTFPPRPSSSNTPKKTFEVTRPTQSCFTNCFAWYTVRPRLRATCLSSLMLSLPCSEICPSTWVAPQPKAARPSTTSALKTITRKTRSSHYCKPWSRFD